MTITHEFVSAKADGGDATLVRPSDWNAEHIITAGSQAVAFAPGASRVGDAYGTTSAITANGGAIANPIHVIAPMQLQSGRFRNTDSSGARSFEWRLYQDVGTNVLEEIPGANGSSSYTATVSSVRDVDAVSAPVLIMPGVYWLVFRNTHATNTFGFGYTAIASSTLGAGITLVSASTISALGSTIDFTAAGDEFTTGGLTRLYGMSLTGRVFGLSTGIYE